MEPTHRPGPGQSDSGDDDDRTGAGRDAYARARSALTEAQGRAVDLDTGALCVVAGAGSGKTRVLTLRVARRILDGTAEADHTVVCTFTRKAAGELRDRLARLGVAEGVAAGTFHSMALAQLRRHHADRGTAMPTVLGSKARVLAPLLGRRDGAGALRVVDVAAEIEWAKARLIAPPRYLEAVAASGREVAQVERIATLYERYEAEKRRRELVDFDDLLLDCATAIERDREFAAAQRWRFRHLFVDEFQDTNRSQFRLLRGWLGLDRDAAGTDVDLCVVGDPDQAIYGFAGAEPRYLESFEELFPGATTVRLGFNYRSTPQVVATSRAVLPANRARLPIATPRPDGPAPTVTEYEDERAEARAVIAAARRAQSGERPWRSMARSFGVFRRLPSSLSATTTFLPSGSKRTMARPPEQQPNKRPCASKHRPLVRLVFQ